MITQGDENKSHSHGITDPGHAHAIPLSDHTEGFAKYSAAALNFYNHAGRTESNKTEISINSSGGMESRPINTSMKIWKRTA